MTEKPIYPVQILRQLAQYGIVANGTAIALFLGAVSSSAGGNLSASVGKIPLWLFFCGLLSGGLHLIFFMFLDFAREVDDVHQAASRLTSGLEAELRDKSGILVIDPTTSKLRSEAQKNLKRAENLVQDPKAIAGARLLQELLLFFSLFFFITGLGLLIAFIDIDKPLELNSPSYHFYGSRIV